MLVLGLSSACTFGSTGAGTGAATSLDASGSAGSTARGSTSGGTATNVGGGDADTSPPPAPPPATGDGSATDDRSDTTTTADTTSDRGDTGEPGFVLCDAADPDLRACYDFAGARSGALTDLSSYGNDGNVTNGVLVAPGPFTSAVRIGGGDSILVADSPSLDLDEPEIAYDVWVWIDAAPQSGRQGIFDNDGQYSIFVYSDDGLRCGFGDTFLYSTAYPTGTWFHLACTGSAAGSQMYIDGVVADEAGAPEDGDQDNDNDVAVLDNSPQLDAPLDGQMAALRIFSRPLTFDEVSAAANAR